MKSVILLLVFVCCIMHTYCQDLSAGSSPYTQPNPSTVSTATSSGAVNDTSTNTLLYTGTSAQTDATKNNATDTSTNRAPNTQAGNPTLSLTSLSLQSLQQATTTKTDTPSNATTDSPTETTATAEATVTADSTPTETATSYSSAASTNNNTSHLPSTLSNTGTSAQTDATKNNATDTSTKNTQAGTPTLSLTGTSSQSLQQTTTTKTDTPSNATTDSPTETTATAEATVTKDSTPTEIATSYFSATSTNNDTSHLSSHSVSNTVTYTTTDISVENLTSVPTGTRTSTSVLSTTVTSTTKSTFRTIAPTIPQDQRHPPPGPPVITGYQPDQTPQNGDTLMCTVTGGAPLVDSVDFRCVIPLIPDQPDDINQTSVSSSVTFNTSQNSSESIVCVCRAFWDEDPTRYNLTASMVFNPPEPSTIRGPDTTASSMSIDETTGSTTTPTENVTLISTAPSSTPVPTPADAKVPPRKEAEDSFPVAVVTACIAGGVFLILILVFIFLGRRGHLSCLGQDYRVTKSSYINGDSTSTSNEYEQMPAPNQALVTPGKGNLHEDPKIERKTGNVLKYATTSQNDTSAQKSPVTQLTIDAGDPATSSEHKASADNPATSSKQEAPSPCWEPAAGLPVKPTNSINSLELFAGSPALPKILISPSDGDYAEIDFEQYSNPTDYTYRSPLPTVREKRHLEEEKVVEMSSASGSSSFAPKGETVIGPLGDEYATISKM